MGKQGEAFSLVERGGETTEIWKPHNMLGVLAGASLRAGVQAELIRGFRRFPAKRCLDEKSFTLAQGASVFPDFPTRPSIWEPAVTVQGPPPERGGVIWGDCQPVARLLSGRVLN